MKSHTLEKETRTKEGQKWPAGGIKSKRKKSRADCGIKHRLTHSRSRCTMQKHGSTITRDARSSWQNKPAEEITHERGNFDFSPAAFLFFCLFLALRGGGWLSRSRGSLFLFSFCFSRFWGAAGLSFFFWVFRPFSQIIFFSTVY